MGKEIIVGIFIGLVIAAFIVTKFIIKKPARPVVVPQPPVSSPGGGDKPK